MELERVQMFVVTLRLGKKIKPTNNTKILKQSQDMQHSLLKISRPASQVHSVIIYVYTEQLCTKRSKNTDMG